MHSYHLFHLSSVKHLFRLEQCDKITRSFPEYLAQHYKTAENKFFGKVCSKFCQKLNTASNILPKTFTFLPKTFTFLPKWRHFANSGHTGLFRKALNFNFLKKNAARGKGNHFCSQKSLSLWQYHISIIRSSVTRW